MDSPEFRYTSNSIESIDARSFTPLELRLIRMAVGDMRYKEMAMNADITVAACKGHWFKIRKKAGCRTNDAVVALALTQGWLTIPTKETTT
jgi:DNA-binding CsgD family transcriptional regulator